jgi:hypothetical protein
MRADLYPKRFAPLGIEVITPHDAEQDEVHHIYMNELLSASSSTPASTGSWGTSRPPGELPDRVGHSLVADA